MPYTQNTTTQNTFNKQTEQQEKPKPLELTAMYKGKTLKTKGIVAEGKKTAGQPYKIYTLVFQQENMQYEKRFNVFNDLSGKSMKIADLEEGETYKLLYNQEAFTMTDGTPGKRNKLFWIGLTTLKPQQNEPMQQAVQKLKQVMSVAPEHQELWDAHIISSFEEWMQIAEESNLFNSEEEAASVWAKLTK